MRWSASLSASAPADPRCSHRRRRQQRIPRAIVRGSTEKAIFAEIARRACDSADGLNSDIHGSAEYRAHLVGVLARRAVAEAIGK